MTGEWVGEVEKRGIIVCSLKFQEDVFTVSGRKRGNSVLMKHLLGPAEGLRASYGRLESVNVQLTSCSAVQGKGLKERKYLGEEG